MGLRVDATKAVSINDAHQEGVDTSVASNPTVAVIKGLEVHHIFSRNGKGGRRDDGNPLIHSLKNQNGFSITQHWKQQLFNRAKDIILKMPDDLRTYDSCLAVPSSSPFCADVTHLVSATLGIPVHAGSPLRKALVGEVLADLTAAEPKMRPSMRDGYTSQLHTWQRMDPLATCQAKLVDTTIRHLFRLLLPSDDLPDLGGRRILIVDDILSSGSSLLSTRSVLANLSVSMVTGITFLGGLKV